MKNNSIFFLNNHESDGEIGTSFLSNDEIEISKESIKITPMNQKQINFGLDKFESIEKVYPVDMIESAENIFRVVALLNDDFAMSVRELKDYNTSQASETLDIIYTLDIVIKILNETRADIQKQMNYFEALERVTEKKAQQQ